MKPRRSGTLPLLTLLVLAFSGAAQAGEQLMEDFSPKSKFALLWPGGQLSQGGDAGLFWLRLQTDGKGSASFATNVRSYQPGLDFRGKFLKVWFKVDDIARLGGMEFRLSSDRFNKSYYAFSFPRYDDLDANVVRSGDWTTLTFSFGSARVEGKPDRSAIDSAGWYLSDQGKGPVSAYWGGLAGVDEPSAGVVTFTFDDGYEEHHLAARLMARHGFVGTAYVIPSSVGDDGYMTLEQLVDLRKTYGWDVAAHHVKAFTSMQPSELEESILGVQRFLIRNGFASGAGHLAYPLGKQDPALVRPLVRKHFTSARVIAQGPETLPPADPHLLRILNVTDTMSPEEVGRAALRARRNREWLILMFHFLVDKPTMATEYAIEDFKAALVEVQKSGARVLPFTQVWSACGRASAEGSAGGKASRGCRVPAASVPAKGKAPRAR